MITTRIIGTGSALPKTTITNDELAKQVDTNDEWIRTRTGICSRHLSNEEESVVTLAVQAGKKALENAAVDPEKIQMVLVATSSSEHFFPSAGCQVSDLLGIKQAVAMDLSAACSGFIFALNTAHAYIKSGIYERVLVIGADTLSKVIDWADRSTCVLFGDGAGACVVEKAETGIEGICQHSDGELGHVLTCSGSTFPSPAAEAVPAKPLGMEGQAVFKFAVKTVPECIREVLEQAKTDVQDVKYFVLHQANSRIIQSVAKRLQVSPEKFPMNLDQYGNTSAASIPILLDEMNREHKLEQGDLLVISGFGAGLTWGADLIRW